MSYRDLEHKRTYEREYIKRPDVRRKRKAQHDSWAAQNPDKIKEYDEKFLQARAQANARRRTSLRQQAIERLGGRCSDPNCKWVNEDGSKGCTDFRVLQIDHVHGGGTRERKKLGYEAMLKKAATGDISYQLLCSNCNWIKRHNNGENTQRKY